MELLIFIVVVAGIFLTDTSPAILCLLGISAMALVRINDHVGYLRREVEKTPRG